MIAAQSDIDHLNQRLAYRLHFTPQDLRANQQAQLSPAQQQVVRATLRAHWRGARGMVIGFLSFYGVLFTISMVTESRRHGQELLLYVQSQALPLLVVTGMFCGVFALVLIGSLFIWGDLRREQVRCAEGSAHCVTDSVQGKYRRHVRYRLFIRQGRLRQQVFLLTSPKVLEGFREGQPYRVYYIRDSPVHLILSGEAL